MLDINLTQCTPTPNILSGTTIQQLRSSRSTKYIKSMNNVCSQTMRQTRDGRPVYIYKMPTERHPPTHKKIQNARTTLNPRLALHYYAQKLPSTKSMVRTVLRLVVQIGPQPILTPRRKTQRNPSKTAPAFLRTNHLKVKYNNENCCSRVLRLEVRRRVPREGCT